MSVYMCLDCYEVFEKDYIKNDILMDDIKCPKTNCIGSLIEVDELMLPTIKILNQKGYFTKFCCSGHYYDQHPEGYITFYEDIKLPNIPKGWHEENFNNCTTIRSFITKGKYRKPKINDFKKICNNAKLLVDWAIKLPNNKY